jgi:hypothetical protein
MNTVYILKLEDNKYYVGKTENINKRVLEHFTNNGSEWTKKYKPIEIINKYKSDDNIYEQRYTWETMVKYGIDNVRGAAHCKIELADSEKEYIKQCINSITDKCYKCGIKGHFAKECDNINTKNNDKILRKMKNIKILFQNVKVIVNSVIIHGFNIKDMMVKMKFMYLAYNVIVGIIGKKICL